MCVCVLLTLNPLRLVLAHGVLRLEGYGLEILGWILRGLAWSFNKD